MNTTANNNQSVSSTSNSATAPTTRDYKLNIVSANKATIRTVIPVSISATRNRKALIAKLSSREIIGYTDTLSITIGDLIPTFVTYFDMSTAMVERDVAVANYSVYALIFLLITWLVSFSSIQKGSQLLLITLLIGHLTFLISHYALPLALKSNM